MINVYLHERVKTYTYYTQTMMNNVNVMCNVTEIGYKKSILADSANLHDYFFISISLLLAGPTSS